MSYFEFDRLSLLLAQVIIHADRLFNVNWSGPPSCATTASSCSTWVGIGTCSHALPLLDHKAPIPTSLSAMDPYLEVPLSLPATCNSRRLIIKAAVTLMKGPPEPLETHAVAGSISPVIHAGLFTPFPTQVLVPLLRSL